MRRAVLAISAIAGLTIPMVASAAGQRHVRFTAKIVGAQISATQAAFKIHDSVFGDGAGVQTLKVKGAGGTDVTKVYYGNGTATSADKFTIGAPDAKGISKLTGSGHDITGTGVARNLHSTYTFSGKFNTKTFSYTVTLKGTYTY